MQYKYKIIIKFTFFNNSAHECNVSFTWCRLHRLHHIAIRVAGYISESIQNSISKYVESPAGYFFERLGLKMSRKSIQNTVSAIGKFLKDWRYKCLENKKMCLRRLF
uniref:Uncharacterized protein n=1 Tax=Cacopsylla melanoneura TaxID=428564 RepID=A0A8D8YEW9_9HEMI